MPETGKYQQANEISTTSTHRVFPDNSPGIYVYRAFMRRIVDLLQELVILYVTYGRSREDEEGNDNGSGERQFNMLNGTPAKKFMDRHTHT